MGRPTKLTPKLHTAAREYIENYKEHDHVIPSVVGMAVVLNVAKSTLYNWAEEDRDGFLDTLEKCDDFQHLALLNGGLTNELNPTITKLALANHGYSEKHDVGVGGRLVVNVDGKDASL